METANPDDVVGNEEECHHCEDKVAPLVGGEHQSADQTRDDHYFIHEDCVENRRPRKAGCEKEVEEQKLCV